MIFVFQKILPVFLYLAPDSLTNNINIMRRLTFEEKLLLEALHSVDDHVRFLLRKKWPNAAIYCCICRRRYQHWAMEMYSKSMVCRRQTERKNADFLRDDEGYPDLEKIYGFFNQRLGHKMRVTKSFNGLYYSDNVRIYICDDISFRIVRDHKDNVKVLHDHFNSDRERGIWMPMDCLDELCNTLEFIFDNYDRFHSIVLKRAALWLKRLGWDPAPDICQLIYDQNEEATVYFAYNDYMYELKMHGYNNRLIINDADKEIRILPHSLKYDIERLRTELIAGNKVQTVSGNEYNEPKLSQILAAAIDSNEQVVEFEDLARKIVGK